MIITVAASLAMDPAERSFTPLPGFSFEFALVFQIPETAKLKDLAYQIASYGDPNIKTSTFRISLTSE
jgi:hypothetical protein